MENSDAYQKAKKRVEEKLGFYNHLGVYVAVNTLLIIVNLVTDRQNLWFQWPLMGWGIALVFHGMGVFVFGANSNIKDRMIKKEMDKDNSN